MSSLPGMIPYAGIGYEAAIGNWTGKARGRRLAGKSMDSEAEHE